MVITFLWKGLIKPIFCDNKIPEYDAYKTKDKGVYGWIFSKKTAHNYLILAQEYIVCFQIIEEAMMKANKYWNAIQVWMKLSRKFDPITGDSTMRLSKNF